MRAVFRPLRSLLLPVLWAVSLGVGALGTAAAAGGRSGSSSVTELPGEVLVKLTSNDALPALLSRYSLTMISRFGSRPIYRLAIVGTAKPKDVAAALSLEPTVLIAEPNITHSSPEARANQPWAIGNPTVYSAQWAPQSMRLSQAQALATGAGVRVALLDTGVDVTHPLLAGRLLPGRDFVDGGFNVADAGSAQVTVNFGHGTHVAGLIATVAPAARIIPLRVLDTSGVGNAWVLSEAMLYAVDPDGNPATDDGAHVINLSLGTLNRTRIMAAIANLASCGGAIPDDPVADQSDPGYNDDRARCAAGNGAVVVAAAGNDGSSQVKEYPAAEGAYGLVAVTASNSSKRLAGFANSGSWIDIAAPGEAITSSVPGGGYATWSGTSMASPLVAGVAALVRSMDLTMSPKDAARRVMRNGSSLCNTNILQVDALGAVTDVTPPRTCR